MTCYYSICVVIKVSIIVAIIIRVRWSRKTDDQRAEGQRIFLKTLKQILPRVVQSQLKLLIEVLEITKVL